MQLVNVSAQCKRSMLSLCAHYVTNLAHTAYSDKAGRNKNEQNVFHLILLHLALLQLGLELLLAFS